MKISRTITTDLRWQGRPMYFLGHEFEATGERQANLSARSIFVEVGQHFVFLTPVDTLLQNRIMGDSFLIALRENNGIYALESLLEEIVRLLVQLPRLGPQHRLLVGVLLGLFPFLLQPVDLRLQLRVLPLQFGNLFVNLLHRRAQTLQFAPQPPAT